MATPAQRLPRYAVLALILSLVGTYGVLSGNVAGRRREIGIRMALGADAASVRTMVLRYAAALTIPGVVLGLVGAWIGSRWIEALLGAESILGLWVAKTSSE